jgi:uncharacterized protein (TIGR02448 family)
MKNSLLSLVALIALITAFEAPHARADDCCEVISTGFKFVGTPGLTLLLLADMTAAPEDRIAYVQTLKDDAAEFVAADGAPSATLQNAIRAVRSQVDSEKNASDQEVARFILNADISL